MINILAISEIYCKIILKYNIILLFQRRKKPLERTSAYLQLKSTTDEECGPDLDDMLCEMISKYRRRNRSLIRAHPADYINGKLGEKTYQDLFNRSANILYGLVQEKNSTSHKLITAVIRSMLTNMEKNWDSVLKDKSKFQEDVAEHMLKLVKDWKFSKSTGHCTGVIIEEPKYFDV